METISICWIPGYRGRHLPVPVVPRSQCYPKTSSSRRYGNCRPSECGIGKINIHLKRKSQLIKFLKLPMTLSTFLHGETPTCPFLPQDRITKTSPTTGHGVSPKLPTPLTPLALSARKNQEDECKGCLQSSTKGQVDSSYPSHTALYWAGAKGSKEGCSLSKSTLNFAGGVLEREIVQKDILSRLKAVEAAAAAADKNSHWAPIISENDHHERLRSADLNDMSNQLAPENKKWVKFPRGLKGPLRETDKQLEHDHNQFTAGTGSGLKHCLPPNLDRLGFHFPTKQNSQRAARVNLTVSCQVSYVVETKHDSVVTGDHDVQLDHAAILDSDLKTCCGKAGGFPRPVDCWTSPKGLPTRKMGRMTQGRGGQMKFRRFQDTTSHLCGGSGGTLGARSRLLVRNIDGTPRRLWSHADYKVEPAGNLFNDWLKIVGLIALVISGTSAFTLSHRYLKSGLWFRKTTPVIVWRSAQEIRRSKAPIL